METLILTLTSAIFAFAVSAALITSAKKDKLDAERRLQALLDVSESEIVRKRVLAGKKKTRIKISAALVDQLASAGVPMRAEEYMLLWIGMAIIPPVLAGLLGARFYVCMVLCALGLALPPFYVKTTRAKRIRAFEDQLGDALISMSNCLKSGLTFQQGMLNVAEQMPEPISKEFARTLREVQLGNTMDGALKNLTRRIPSPDLKLMITAVLITQQVGGSLSEVMDSIANTIIDRLRVKSEVQALTAQGRMSGLVIGCLPIVIGLILSVINPDYMKFFIENSVGRILIIVCVCMELIGALVIRKIITIKY